MKTFDWQDWGLGNYGAQPFVFKFESENVTPEITSYYPFYLLESNPNGKYKPHLIYMRNEKYTGRKVLGDWSALSEAKSVCKKHFMSFLKS